MLQLDILNNINNIILSALTVKQKQLVDKILELQKIVLIDLDVETM